MAKRLEKTNVHQSQRKVTQLLQLSANSSIISKFSSQLKRKAQSSPHCNYLTDHRISIFTFINYSKAYIEHEKLWEDMKEIDIPDHLI